MKKLILLTLGFLFLASSAFADKFIVVSYKHEPTNLAARVHQRKDNNDETCGLVLVRTSIINLGVLAGTGVVGSVDFKDGYYWVYLSPGTRRISFYKEGFERLDYDLPEPVKSQETYILTLRYRSTGNSPAGNTMGFVVIKSNPSGADVYVNDTATGLQTPFQNPYNEGYYRFTLKKPFYDNYSGNFEIHGNKTSQLNVKLAPDFGTLTVITKPEIKATVNIDGEDKGLTPDTVTMLSPGNHILHVTKDMYLPWQENITISKGKSTQRTITMKPNFGTIDVNAQEGDAIYIDNRQMGSGSYTGRLLRGAHIVRVEHQHYYSQSKQVKTLPGQNLTESFKLQPKTGTLSVMTTPIGANIFINDKPMGQSPKFIASLKVGTYTVKLQKQGYATVEKQAEITENRTTPIKETLPSGINVQFTSQPSGSKLYIDGKYEGTTPLELSVNFGKHNIKLINGKQTIEKNILSSAKTPPRLNFNLFENYTETTQNLKIKYQPSIPTDGLIAHFEFNGNISNASDKYIIGTNKGASLDYDRNNQSNMAYYFNGRSWIEYNFRLPTGNDPRSFSVWFKTNSNSGSGGWGHNTILCYGSRSKHELNSLSIYQGKVCFASWDQDFYSKRNYNDNRWHNLILTANGTKVKVYVDNDLIIDEYASLNTKQSKFYVGRRINEGNQFFNGSIDDVIIYNRPLNPDEIRMIYNE